MSLRSALFAWIAAFALVLWLTPEPLPLSDHADPALDPPPSQNAGITGLFVFPEGDRLIVILNIHRGLTTPPPYELEPWEYTVHMDLEGRVAYDDPEDLARDGGTVLAPEEIRSTAAVRFRLNDDATLREGYPSFEGSLAGARGFRAYAGVRDDPFIFPPFFGTNVIAMALSIPFSAFPAGQRDWLLWGTVTEAESGELVDHVGRANRTQLGRLDFLNTLPPSEQLQAIEAKRRSGQGFSRTVMHFMSHLPRLGGVESAFQLLLQVRDYDLAPDVMIFSTRFPPGFPNGRRLEDDIVGLTCAQGDCALQEVAFMEGGWPRPVTNDRPFLDEFPYLAEPWPASEAHEEASRHSRDWILVLLVGLLLAGPVLFVCCLYRWWRRRQAAGPG